MIKFSFLLSLLILCFSSFAQVPLNDNPCSGTTVSAINLTPSAACSYATFSNVDASNSTGPGIPNPSCVGFQDADVWFTATVPTGATTIVIDTKNLSLTDGTMAVYTVTGSCPNLTMTEIACADVGSANPGMPKITVNQPAGTTVYIRFWGFAGETGTFGICVTANIPPVNDDCANATNLTVNPNLLCGTVTAGTTNNATMSTTTPSPTCGTVNGWNDDVWYTFTATGAVHNISLLNITPTTSMTMVLYSGTCGALTQVNCANANTLTVNGLTAGTVYTIRVYTNGSTSAFMASFNICVGTPPPPPANDECLMATSLTVNPDFNCGIVTAGTTVSATQSSTTPTPTCTAANGWNDDVWYSFVATNTAHRVSLLNVTGATIDMATAVYSGTCGSLTQLSCIDPDPNVVNLTGLTIGATYYVRVMTWSATSTITASFNICVGTPPPPPANDNCAGAVSLTVNPNLNCGAVTAGTTMSATVSVGAPSPSCGIANATDDDVWFSFIATNTTHRLTIANVAPANTMVMVVYSGTCGLLTELACNTTSLLQVSALIPGATYYVRVYTNSATIGNNSNFNICVGTPPPPPPNDDCMGAVSLTVNPSYTCTAVTAGNTAGATQSVSAPTPTCSATGINDDVWFSFVATGITHRISLLNISGGTGMTSVVYSGSCVALTQLNCTTANLYNVTGLTAGQTYYVREFTTVATVTTDATFNICVGTPPPPPVNDECTGAISLTVNPNQLCGTVTAGTTEGATQSSNLPSPTCSAANGWNDDVWYSFVANGASHTVSLLNVTGTSTDMITSVYQGTCGSLTQIQCVDPDPNVINMSNLTAGTTYYIRVQTASSGPVNASFDICVGTPGPGAVCSAGNPFCSTSGATYPSVTNQPSLGGGGIYGCLVTTPNPTWFYMQVSSPGNLVFQVSQTSTGGMGIDVDYAAWGPFTSQADGCNQLAAGGITPISCSYSTAAVETITIPNSMTGQFYIVLITNFNGGAGTITFNTTTGNVGSTNCNIICNATASNNGPVCPGGAFNLTSTANSGSTFSWTGPGMFTSNQQNPMNVTAPSTPGSYVYNVTATTNNTACSASTTVVVTTTNPATLTLSSATSTTSQSVCTNTAINNITYSVGGSATGATVTGLPPGVSGSFAAGTFTISGIPTAAGVFNYTVTSTGGCGSAQQTGSVTVSTAATLTLTSPVSTTTQTLCVNNAITNITYSVGGSGTGASVTGLPAGVTGNFSAGIFTISGTPTVSGTFPYTVISTGGCGTAQRTGTITVTAPSSMTLTSAPTTTGQTVCVNTAIANITYSVSGATGASVTGLPAGVSSSFTGGNLLISGIPTTSGTFNYSVSTTGGCTVVTLSGSVTVTAAATINLTSGSPTATQTLCISTPLTPITYSIGGSATGAGVSGLPAGLNGIFSGGVFTISGIPTVSGTFPYTVTTMGGCGSPTASGSITVTPAATLTLSSLPATSSQSVCINTPLNNITYAAGGSATGVSVSTLPAGVTATFAGGTLTISGTPTVAGNYSYTVSTTGGCGSVSLPGTISVSGVATLSLSSLASTANQVLCINNSLLNIIYNVGGGGTGAVVTGLPAGVTGIYAGGVFTISGSPTVSGTFPFSVSTTGGCATPILTGQIKVNPALTANAGNSVVIAYGTQTQLNGTGTAGANYLWTANGPLALSSPSMLMPIANPLQTTVYTLTVSDPSGLCTPASSTVVVTVATTCTNVRNAFTPNGDGINDTWLVYDQAFCLKPGGVTVNVFNRYGSKVFESSNYTNTWNGTYKGKPVPDGTYYAIVEFTFANGTKQIIRTDLTVLR